MSVAVTGMPDPSWTAGPPNTLPSRGLHDAVARTALFRPDAIALISGNRTVTYAELDRTADAWAAGLVAAGVSPGDFVPVLLPRSVDLVTALLAVLKAGAAYALLDPAWPTDRLNDVTGELGASFIIATSKTLSLPGWSPPAEATAPGFRPVEVDGSAPCCVFFTSGTTGRPKGVLTPHRATARLFQPNTFARFTTDTVVPLAAPMPWDAFSLELWSVLLNGGTSLIIDEPYLSAQSLRSGVTRHGVDTIWLTSSLFNMIVDEDLGAFHGLSQVMIGGERLSTVHVGRFLRQHPEIVLLNGYGPVESAVFATTHRISEADCARPGGIPLGRPVPGTQVYVLDGSRPCAVGESGEICIGGDGLALRYLGDTTLTDAKFSLVPIDGRVVRVYRTGDLGVWGDDGLLHFRGRADRQVKIRGHRIEPADVERQIERLLPVRSCRVLARRDDAGNAQELVAFCVPSEPGNPLANAATVLRALFPHQRPGAVVSVESFPVTAQGKLDERSLLAMAPSGEPVSVGDVTYEDNTVGLVAEIFCGVLGRPAVPLDVSFWDLGGGSLGAGRVCARLAARLSRPVPISGLYEHPTVAGVADWLRSTGSSAPQVPDSTEVALTPMQLVYLMRHLRDPTDMTSHCLLTWVIDGPLDRSKLEAAIAAVHQRHESLRAAYVADPSPAAILVDIEAPPLEILPAQKSVESAISELRVLLSDELEPTEGDVWRTALVPLETGAVFGCAVHHIAFDGWSESVLANDLAAAYNGVRQTEAAPSLSATVHSDTDLSAHTEYLRAELAGVPALQWPTGLTERLPSEPGLVETLLPPSIVAAVDAQAVAAGVSRFVVLLSHHAGALAEVTGQDDFAVGVPVAQRYAPGLEFAVGCHINMLGIRLRGDDIAETGRVVARAFAAQEVPFAEILRLAPAFQTLFALQDNAIPHLPLDGLRTEFIRQPYLDLPLELHTELWPSPGGGLRLTVYYRSEVVPETTAQEFAKRFTDRLHTLLSGART